MQNSATSCYRHEQLIFDQVATSSASTVTCQPGTDLCEAEQASTHTDQSISAPRAQQDTPVRPLTAAQRAFAEGIARGETHKAAYRAAYPGDSSTDASISTSASRLLKDPRIQKLLCEAQEADPEVLLDDPTAMKRYVLVQLLRCATQFKQEGSRIKALELLGRSAGMFQVQVATPVAPVTAMQLKRELASHLTLLENVPKESVDVADIKLLQH